MSDETRQEKSSVESTVGGAAKTGKAIANIAKGAAVGGAHGAAIEAAKTSKKWIYAQLRFWRPSACPRRTNSSN